MKIISHLLSGQFVPNCCLLSLTNTNVEKVEYNNVVRPSGGTGLSTSFQIHARSAAYQFSLLFLLPFFFHSPLLSPTCSLSPPIDFFFAISRPMFRFQISLSISLTVPCPPTTTDETSSGCHPIIENKTINFERVDITI